tara:strand:- start:23 stop:781 length:759 start_codon:yes stop_codon:yes gene_type:complete
VSHFKDLIKDFDPITLDEMDEVKLMSRTDTKFAFSSAKLPQLLSRMLPFYRILNINNKLIHDYKSLYYDTSENKFYLDHHNNRVNRNKIRFREYVDSGLVFLEIKTKNNKGKTIKKRMKVKSISDKLNSEQQEYINKIIGNEISVEPKQWINFYRMTFVHKKQKERLTVDVDLTFSENDKKGDLKNIIIGEVKQERMSRSSDFMRIAKDLNILPIRISKYCMSTLSLHPNLKSNRFKPKVLFIEKLKNYNLN